MSKKMTVAAFVAGAVCTGSLAFVIGAGPEDAKNALKKTADGYVQRGQDAAKDAMGGQPEMTPEAMAEMEAWMKLGAPGEQHKMLAKSVGEWSATTWFKMDPNAPAMEGTGWMKTQPILGGRYFKSHYHMDDMMGMPFDGHALMGYDNGAGHYVSTWIDSMSTGIYSQTGTMSSDGNKLIMMGTMTGPEGEETMKMVSEWHGDNKFTDSMYDLIDGEWNLHGKITYTRKGHADAGG
ncbi:MAG: hypothetical protein DHS20C14_18320 [Phycisphaeraceae bacterium]|nr:MAG: hypothetical protein DHS20C14_18320 [Phycisphaeraceae bacterium]